VRLDHRQHAKAIENLLDNIGPEQIGKRNRHRVHDVAIKAAQLLTVLHVERCVCRPAIAKVTINDAIQAVDDQNQAFFALLLDLCFGIWQKLIEITYQLRDLWVQLPAGFRPDSIGGILEQVDDQCPPLRTIDALNRYPAASCVSRSFSCRSISKCSRMFPANTSEMPDTSANCSSVAVWMLCNDPR